jgi:hypothetical protein
LISTEIRRAIPDAGQDSSRFDAEDVRRYLVARGYHEPNLVRYLHRPFDPRWLYWEHETKLLDEKRAESRSSHFPENIWIAACQQNRKDYSPPLVTKTTASRHAIERGANLFPAFIRSQHATLYEEQGTVKPNTSPKLADFLTRLKSEPKHAFDHAIAVLHSPEYARENATALRQDWPRVPIPNSAELLSASAALGRELADLLGPDAPVPGVTTGQIRRSLQSIAIISCTEDRQLDPARDLSLTAGWGHAGKGGAIMPAKGRTLGREYSPQELETFASVPESLTLLGSRAIDVYLNDAAYWRNIPEAVWEYTIGGYQVLKKWLSYREQEILSRPLHVEETRLFTQIARRIASILLLSPQLDSNYESVRANPTSF